MLPKLFKIIFKNDLSAGNSRKAGGQLSVDYLRKLSNPSTQSTMVILFLIVSSQRNTIKTMFILEKRSWEAGIMLSVCTTCFPHLPPPWRHPLSCRGQMIPCGPDALPKTVHRQHSTPNLVTTTTSYTPKGSHVG